ncbi:MAG: MotA/TolQ/ExbB proton channel family protein [Algiphilus sp.]|nr:MotA/TolQ/ExbB proton channel family protein [Algiphilus sp.]
MKRFRSSRTLWMAVFGLALGTVPQMAPAQPADTEGTTNGLQQLLEDTRAARQREQALHREREAAFLEERDQQQQKLRQATQRLEAAQQRADALSAAFDDNEATLSALETEIQNKAGAVGELFGVYRQVAGDTASLLEASLISAQYPERRAFLEEAAQREALPSIDTLEALRFEILREMTAAGEVVRFEAPVVAADGEVHRTEVLRIGPFSAVDAAGFLGYLPESQRYFELSRQPGGGAAAAARTLYEADGGMQTAVIDPTRGALLTTLVKRPSLGEYVDAGGLVGRIIIGLALVGFAIALWRALALVRVSGAVRRQAQRVDQPADDNPLGRVLASYRPDADTETLQLQLDDAVLRELPGIERGLGAIKVLAAVGPLLGLLGTVTGMILTFQQITLFGTGDPKLMADGISQALVTTVLGLIMAIPLVLLHSALRARADGVIQVLEEQSAGMVAELAEQRRS